MKFLLALLISNTLVIEGICQTNIIEFPNCNLGAFCLDCDEVRVNLEPGTSITDYFLERIGEEKIKGISGKLSIEVMVDVKGKSCCRTIGNMSNVSNDIIKKLNIAEIINDMPLWELKKEKERKENNLIMLEMKFINQTISISYIALEISTTPPWEK